MREIEIEIEIPTIYAQKSWKFHGQCEQFFPRFQCQVVKLAENC